MSQKPNERTIEQVDVDLAELAAACVFDPLRWAYEAFPWGAPGLLATTNGPCPCQVRVLTTLRDEVRARKFDGKRAVRPIRMAVASGHGIGKSVLFGILCNWIMSTRPNAQGTATANTFSQLETKTWATIRAMAKLSLTAHWFEIGASRIYRIKNQETWFASPQSCAEENSEAFAGQHAASSTSFYLNDECSAIPDAIFEVQEGGLSDGEPMQFLFGNPTRSLGKFHRAMWGSDQHRYTRITIDSRECPLTNKEQIQEWVDDYGEDSDFVRVRVKGLPPRASDSQFIDSDLVMEAQRRPLLGQPGEPLIMGVDLSWGGEDFSAIRFRRGMDARSIPPIRVPGEQTREPMRMVLVIAGALQKYKVDACFIDAAGSCGPVARKLRELGHRNVFEVNFGAHSLDEKHENMRSYMYGQLKQWLQDGGCIDRDAGLTEDLTALGYSLTNKTKILLEKKQTVIKRIGHSTDDSDSLALCLAAPVKAKKPPEDKERKRWLQEGEGISGSWMT